MPPIRETRRRRIKRWTFPKRRAIFLKNLVQWTIKNTEPNLDQFVMVVLSHNVPDLLVALRPASPPTIALFYYLIPCFFFISHNLSRPGLIPLHLNKLISYLFLLQIVHVHFIFIYTYVQHHRLLFFFFGFFLSTYNSTSFNLNFCVYFY